MINIVENKPSKLSGVTSLYVSFSYNPEIINIIKSCDKYVYDKKTYTWELPITTLTYLLDNLTYIDDITLKLYKEDSNTEHYYPKLLYKTKPFKHQLDGIEFGLNHDNWLLLDQPGLGKSKTIINLAEELKAQKGLEHCLIICGINTLKSNWKKEIKLHSNLSCRVIGEKISKKGNVSYASVKERAAELKQPLDAFFYIINVESLRSEDVIEAIKKSSNKIDMIVFDEVHKANNSSSQQGHNLLKLKDHKYKIGLTGTLLTNNPLNAYLPLKWIGVEHSTLTNFKSQYCEFGGFGGYQIVGYKNIDILKEEIDACSLRRTKDLLNLPPKNVIVELVEMNPLHSKFYENVKDGVKEECNKIELKTNNVLALTTRLRQATSCPSILTTENIPSSKIERCLDLVEEIVSQGDKVVIMSNFKEPVNQLANLLKDYNPLLGTGDLKDDIVSKNIDLFQTNDKYKVFIGTHAKMGTGVTLNAARYMILLDTPWTYAFTEQVEDRIHRVTNTEPVFIYRLICQGTIDEMVESIIETKKAFSDFIIDDKVTDDVIKILRDYIEQL